MSHASYWKRFLVWGLSAAGWSGASCGVGLEPESQAEAEVTGLRLALEDACASAPADATGDFLAIMSSTEALDLAGPQLYGSAACSGFVFEFDNPEQEPLHGAWVQASGYSQSEADVFGASRCAQRGLQAEYWGYQDKEWTRLAAVESSAAFAADSEQGADYCALDALIIEESSFEKLRVVARVSDGSETYPMIACLW